MKPLDIAMMLSCTCQLAALYSQSSAWVDGGEGALPFTAFDIGYMLAVVLVYTAQILRRSGIADLGAQRGHLFAATSILVNDLRTTACSRIIR